MLRVWSSRRAVNAAPGNEVQRHLPMQALLPGKGDRLALVRVVLSTAVQT